MNRNKNETDDRHDGAGNDLAQSWHYDLNSDNGIKSQTRVEHSRSIDDAEKFKAMETLKDAGLFQSVIDTDTWHGRRASPGERDWKVDPLYRSGRINVNDRLTLYTIDKERAKSVAERRLKAKGDRGRAEVYDIESWDSDAVIMNPFENISKDDYPKVVQALSKLLPNPRIAADVRFDEQDDARRWFDCYDKIMAGTSHNYSHIKARDNGQAGDLISSLQKLGMIDTNMEAKMAQMLSLSNSLSSRLAGAVNARALINRQPTEAMQIYADLKSHVEIYSYASESKGREEERVRLFGKYSFSHEYVTEFCRKAHVVGLVQLVSSPSLNETTYSNDIFDLRKVNTVDALRSERLGWDKYLGRWSQLFGEHHRNEAFCPRGKVDLLQPRELSPEEKLKDTLANPYSKPGDLVWAATQIGGFDKIYQMPSGVWEGYTLAQHTETVLENFDKNYADTVPVELLEPMRLALLVHDIGKPIAKQETGSTANQMPYNLKYGDQFMKQLGIDGKERDLVLAMIGKGMNFAFDSNIDKKGSSREGARRRQKEARQQFYNFALQTASDFVGRQVSDDDVKGFVLMCEILQVCDGGAYTDVARTHDHGNNISYKNYPSFNSSYKLPDDSLDYRAQRMLMRKRD